MANHGQPSRLLTLPPELRVRVYECLFEAESQQPDIDLFAVKDFAPNPAILSTNHLIRHEALPIAQPAITRFSQHTPSTEIPPTKLGKTYPTYATF
ncbi:hypothetical protein LTR17_007161 [Elasticomyces elasticus]|nr:hypothetical protein LTR17_007161 [Elasticomyces elasticus]